VIVVAGEALIDLVVGTDGSETPYPGGGPFNTARTIARLGQDVAFLGRISGDAYGRLLRARLEEDGVRTDLVAPTSDPTTVVPAEIDADGVARYHFDLEGTSAPGLTWADVERALHPAPCALHAGTLGLTVPPMADAVARLVATVPIETLVMVDVNGRPGAVADPGAYRTRMWTVLRRADVVKASTADLDLLAPEQSAEATIATIIGHGARVVLLTRGAEDVIVTTRTHRYESPVPGIDVVDTIGAGDAFGGGFLAWWSRLGRWRDGLEDMGVLREAVAFATRVATITCQRAGADPPWRAEIDS
jgi:fructokinase